MLLRIEIGRHVFRKEDVISGRLLMYDCVANSTIWMIRRRTTTTTTRVLNLDNLSDDLTHPLAHYQMETNRHQSPPTLQ